MKKHLEPPLLLLILLVSFPQISETIYTPSLPELASLMQVGNAMVNMTLSIYFIGFALGVFLWGRLSDRFGRRPTMLWGLGLYIGGCLLCYSSLNINGFIIARFIQGFGASVGSVVTQTIMRDIYHGPRRSQVFSIISGAIALTPALGPLIGGYVIELWGFHANFIVLLVMGIGIFLYTKSYLRETRPQETIAASAIAPLFMRMVKDKNIWIFAFLIAASNGVLFSYYGEAPFLFMELLKFKARHYGMFGVFVAVPILLASFASHRLNTKIKSDRVILLGTAIMIVGALSLLMSAKFDLVKHSLGAAGVLALMLPMTLIFFGVGLVIPNAISMALENYRSVLGSAGAIFGLMYYVMIAVMTEIMGLIHDGSLKPMAMYFLLLSFMMSASCFLRKKSFVLNALSEQKWPDAHRT